MGIREVKEASRRRTGHRQPKSDRTCRSCNRIKPWDEFWKERRTGKPQAYGVSGYLAKACRECREKDRQRKTAAKTSRAKHRSGLDRLINEQRTKVARDILSRYEGQNELLLEHQAAFGETHEMPGADVQSLILETARELGVVAASPIYHGIGPDGELGINGTWLLFHVPPGDRPLREA